MVRPADEPGTCCCTWVEAVSVGKDSFALRRHSVPGPELEHVQLVLGPEQLEQHVAYSEPRLVAVAARQEQVFC